MSIKIIENLSGGYLGKVLEILWKISRSLFEILCRETEGAPRSCEAPRKRQGGGRAKGPGSSPRGRPGTGPEGRGSNEPAREHPQASHGHQPAGPSGCWLRISAAGLGRLARRGPVLPGLPLPRLVHSPHSHPPPSACSFWPVPSSASLSSQLQPPPAPSEAFSALPRLSPPGSAS